MHTQYNITSASTYILFFLSFASLVLSFWLQQQSEFGNTLFHGFYSDHNDGLWFRPGFSLRNTVDYVWSHIKEDLGKETEKRRTDLWNLYFLTIITTKWGPHFPFCVMNQNVIRTSWLWVSKPDCFVFNLLFFPSCFLFVSFSVNIDVGIAFNLSPQVSVWYMSICVRARVMTVMTQYNPIRYDTTNGSIDR